MSDETLQTLRLKRVAIDTYRENVAYLHRDCPKYHTEGFQALSRVEVTSTGDKDSYAILAVLNIVDDSGIIENNELGLSAVSYTHLRAHET